MSVTTQGSEPALGDFSLPPFTRDITTSSPTAKSWVEVGFIWSYAFNHAEAARSFEKAIAVDPDCAVAYWGLAYALGPNYNKPWFTFDQEDVRRTIARASRAIERAESLAHASQPVERALINALKHRFPKGPDGEPNFDSCNRAYVEGMGKAYAEFPDDLDIAAIYADALMNLTPWELWDLRTGKPAPGSRVLEAQDVLTRALASQGGDAHIGLLHLYVHLVEMSQSPERGLPAADTLRRIGGDAGHLVHMPSHLDVLVGDYRRAIAANEAASIANDKLVRLRGADDFYTVYRMHDLHSLVYAAMFSGNFAIALEGSEKILAALPAVKLSIESPPMADWLESFCTVKTHVLIRFGKWQEIIDLSLPADQKLYCVTTATIHYAKGVALAALGNVSEAAKQQELYIAAKDRVPTSRMEYPNTCADILAVGEKMLEGELEYRRGNIDSAFASLRRAIELEDALVYAEPWAWMQPVRHAYAALLMEQGRVEEAAEVYREDLGLSDKALRGRHHPNNIWALHGYHECAVKLGLDGEVKMLEQQLKLAMVFCDVPVRASCYCRREVEENLVCCSK